MGSTSGVLALLVGRGAHGLLLLPAPVLGLLAGPAAGRQPVGRTT